MVKTCPDCERTFDHDPAKCWACEILTVYDDQAGLGAYQ